MGLLPILAQSTETARALGRSTQRKALVCEKKKEEKATEVFVGGGAPKEKHSCVRRKKKRRPQKSTLGTYHV
jgi:hypothetical protein